MDHMMPGMDGIEAARIIREEIGTEYAKKVPVIALTANAITGNEQLFLSSGFQAFLPKPIEISRLDSVIREFIRDKEQEKLLSEKQFEVDGEMIPDSRSGMERRSGLDRRHYRNISGINVEKGLRRFNNDRESYMRVLRSFIVDTPPLLEILKQSNFDNLENYAVTVHGIKGSSRGIGADEIGDKAEALEKAARAGEHDFIRKYNSAFIEETAKLISDLEIMLGKIEGENPKQKKEKPDSETLRRLLSACEKYQMDEADAAMLELESYQYESGGELVEWLRLNVAQMNSQKIIEKLSSDML
jgi:CheY-like chemotaxis protein